MDIAKGGPNSGPQGPFMSLAALNAYDFPDGKEGTWLVFDSSFNDGAHSFMWDSTNSAWKDLGVYQATGIGNGAVDTRNIAEKAVTSNKTDFLKVGKNKFNPENAVHGFIKSDGTIDPSEFVDYETTGHIPVYGTKIIASKSRFSAFYDVNSILVGAVLENKSGVAVDVPATAATYRNTYVTGDKNVLQIEFSETLSDYEPYWQKIENLKLDFLNPTKNKFNPINAQSGYITTSGGLSPLASEETSDYILVPASAKKAYVTAAHTIGLYNLNKAWYETKVPPSLKVFEIDLSEGRARYLRVSYQIRYKNQVQVSFDDVTKEYVPYGKKMSGSLVSANDIVENEIDFSIALPNKIYATVGKPLVLFSQNLVGNKESDYNFIYETTSDGKDKGDKFELNPVGIGQQNLNVSLYKQRYLKSLKVTSIVKSNKRTTPIKVMVIGDSFIANKQITKHIKDTLGDNVVLLGRMGDTGNFYEGNGGWTFDSYYKGSSSPFLNNGVFDFQHYLTTYSIEIPDVVIFHLGINDSTSLTSDEAVQKNINTIKTQFDKMIESIKLANPTVKVAWCTAPFPKEDSELAGETYGTSKPHWRERANRHMLNDGMIKNYEGKIDIIPSHAVLDVFNNMENYIHADLNGYNQIGEQITNYLNSI